MYVCKDCGEKYHGNFGSCGKCGGEIVAEQTQSLPYQEIITKPKMDRRDKSLLATAMVVILLGMIISFSHSAVPATQPITATQRIASKAIFDKWFLREGYDVLIRISGDEAKDMEVECSIFTRVSVQRFEDKGALRRELAKMGFQRAIFYGYQRQFIGSVFAD